MKKHIKINKNTLKTTEKDYDLQSIKRLTPYLNDISYKSSNHLTDNLTRKPTIKQRGFAWYYVYNGGNATDAYRRAYFSSRDPKTGKLLAKKEINKQSCTVTGYTTLRLTYVQEMIRRIRKEIESKIKMDIGTSLLDQLVVQATYDPGMFMKPDGSPTFEDWEDIPEKYRCCVEGIETRWFGKDSQQKQVVIKLVNRDNARTQLMKIVPELLTPDKMEVIHKTVDKDGNETGIDFSKYSDEALMDILHRVQQKN